MKKVRSLDPILPKQAAVSAASERTSVAEGCGEDVREGTDDGISVPPLENDMLLDLPAILDLKAAAPLAAAFLARRGSELVVGASNVQRLGGLCLQVLLSALTSWRADGQPISFAMPSPDFQSALALFGVEIVQTKPGIFVYQEEAFS